MEEPMTESVVKEPYEQPMLVEVGSFSELTAAGGIDRNDFFDSYA
ncbi:lasso RiPP family leader peptide-containing protein [Streptomyces hainanensis]|nr:lasso RiPP family leader peptide-containing protein [Streptomyces hainanensis]